MMESRLGLSATAHVAAARDIIRFVDLDTAWMPAQDPVVGGITSTGEWVTLPDGPGLGAAFEESFLARCPRSTVS
jgi:L-alanine-DL-glutamate epimerase-like enolase superfamily enzyme